VETSKATTRGRIVIPAKIRQKFGFKKGIKIAFAELQGRLIIQPLDQIYFLDLAGILGTDGQMLKPLMEGKKKERRL
jgi:AbrB family looped-hinge helix DNA binding protein